ncbi:MAG: response regulator [Pyrinomonadaceae bacterium]
MPPISKTRGTILIADDYADNRELLRLMLESVGYVVREARDGAECVAMARANPPDVALIDISMPVMDGWSVLEQLREDERTRAIPCIAFTAFTALEDRRRAMEAGFAGYLGKPYVSADLFGMIERLLARD